jgi:hypothetical protein
MKFWAHRACRSSQSCRNGRSGRAALRIGLFRQPLMRSGSSGPRDAAARFLLRVKGGIVLAFWEKTAFGSRSGLGAYGIGRKSARPVSTQVYRADGGPVGSRWMFPYCQAFDWLSPQACGRQPCFEFTYLLHARTRHFACNSRVLRASLTRQSMAPLGRSRPARCEEMFIFPSRTDQKVPRVAGVARNPMLRIRATRGTRGTFWSLRRADVNISLANRRALRLGVPRRAFAEEIQSARPQRTSSW